MLPAGDRRREWVAVALLVLAVLWQTLPLIAGDYAAQTILGTDSYRSHDWLEVATFDHFARRSLLQEGTFPWWNPLLAGGLPQAAHPSDGSLSPLILPSLLFGEALGMKLNIIAVALLGTLGVFALGRRVLGLGLAASFVAGFAYAWSGWLPARVAVGFYESCLMAAWPAVLALWLAPGEPSARRRRWCLAALLLWALALQLQLAVPVFVVLMAVVWVAEAGIRWSTARTVPTGLLVGGVVVLALAGMLGAVKYLPMLDSLSTANFRAVKEYPNHPDAWYHGWQQVWYGLFHHVPGVPITDRDGNPRIQEYMTLLPGAGTVVLAALGGLAVLRGRSRAAIPWLVVGGVFLWLSFGLHAPVDGFRLLRRLPLFGSMRGPLRYLNYPVLLSICLLAGVGFEVLRTELTTRGGGARAVAVAVGVFGLVNAPAALDVRGLYETSFLYGLPPQATPEVVRSERLTGISTGGSDQRNLRKYVNLVRGVPTVFTPEDVPIKVSASAVGRLDEHGGLIPELDYYGEAWAADPALPGRPLAADQGVVAVLRYRSSAVDVAHDLRVPTAVVVNQNASPGWDCDRPIRTTAAETLGLLAFEAPAGPATTTCTWSPPTLRAGLAVSALGWIGVIALWPWRRRRGRRGG